MADTLPQPERRRSFTPKLRAWIALEQGYKCAHCECSLITRPFQIDHIQRLDALGKHEPDNWQALCVPCHAIKTKVDNREAKKGARIRLEKGQQARRKAKGSQIKSRPTVWPKRKLQSRGFQK